MAWVAFQKSNWTRTVSSEHSRQYFPASLTSGQLGGVTLAAGGQLTATLTCAFQFQGNGQVEVSAPFGVSNYATAAAQGLILTSAYLEPAASGSYAKGNHPLIICNFIAAAALTTAATGFDLLAVQY